MIDEKSNNTKKILSRDNMTTSPTIEEETSTIEETSSTIEVTEKLKKFIVVEIYMAYANHDYYWAPSVEELYKALVKNKMYPMDSEDIGDMLTRDLTPRGFDVIDLEDMKTYSWKEANTPRFTKIDSEKIKDIQKL